MILNQAANILLGQTTVQAVYSKLEQVWPSGGTVDERYYYTLDENDNASLLYYYGDNTSINMPAELNGNAITKISDTCHSYDGIASITIPDGVTEIQ